MALVMVITCLPVAARAQAPSRAHEVDVDWSAESPEIDAEDALRRFRVGPNDTVTIRVRNFNFLSYRLEVNTTTRVDAAYKTLSQLWERIFPVLGLLAKVPVAGGFEEPMFFWKVAIDELKKALEEFDKEAYLRPRAFAPRSAELDAIRGAMSGLPDRLATMRDWREKTRALVVTADQGAQFAVIDALHKELEAAAAVFLSTAHMIVNGQSTFVSTHEVGTVVMVSLRQVREADAATVQAASVDFMVLNPRRLLYHIGYEAAMIDDFTFKQVVSVSGADFYLLDSTSTSAMGLSAYMSAELKAWGPNQRYALLGTLGTTLEEPGKTVTVGASLRIFARLIATVGFHATNVEEGADPVGDSPNVFSRVVSSVKAGPVFAVSVKVY